MEVESTSIEEIIIMNALRKVYALSSGSYSDYSVMGVCEDKATAERWAEFINSEKDRYDQVEIEEMFMIPFDTEPYTVTRHKIEITLWDDGREDKIIYNTCSGTPISIYENPPKRPKVRKVRAPVHNDSGGRVEVTGPSEKSVVKVLGEQLSMWRAANPKSIYWGKL